MKDEQWANLYMYAKNQMGIHKNFVEVKLNLFEKTNDHQLTAEILTQIKKVQYAIKAKNGRAKIGFGAIFLLIGFLIIFIDFYSNQPFSFVTYSFSTIGLVLMLWGLYDLIG